MAIEVFLAALAEAAEELFSSLPRHVVAQDRGDAKLTVESAEQLNSCCRLPPALPAWNYCFHHLSRLFLFLQREIIALFLLDLI